MARRATSLGPKASLYIFCFVFCFYCFCLFGPPHLALNPPFFCLFFCLFVLFFWGGCFLFPFFASEWQKNQFSAQKRHFCLFLSVSLCFSWAFFGRPLVQFLSLSLSLSLYLSLSFLFFSFFIPSCLSFFAFFWFLIFLSFFLLLSSWLLFHEN